MNLQSIASIAQYAPRFVTRTIKDAVEYERQLSFINLRLKASYDGAVDVNTPDIEAIARELSKYLPYSAYDLLDSLTVGLTRFSYMALDYIGLDGVNIRSDYDYFVSHGASNKVAWYWAVTNEAIRTLDKFGTKPYTIKTKVIDCGNGYGRVDYVLGNDLLIPSNYAQSIMRTAISQIRIPIRVDSGRLRDSLSRTEIPRIAQIGTKVQYVKVNYPHTVLPLATLP